MMMCSIYGLHARLSFSTLIRQSRSRRGKRCSRPSDSDCMAVWPRIASAVVLVVAGADHLKRSLSSGGLPRVAAALRLCLCHAVLERALCLRVPFRRPTPVAGSEPAQCSLIRQEG